MRLKDYDEKVSQVGGYWFGGAIAFAITAILGRRPLAALTAAIMFLLGLDDYRRYRNAA